MKKILSIAVLLTASSIQSSIPADSTPLPTLPPLAQTDPSEGLLTPQEVRQVAKNITVRISSANNGGSGVLIARKDDSYLVLTNAHVVRRATQLEIQAPDGQKYQATPIDGGFSTKYDLALLKFTSKTKYTLAKLNDVAGTPIAPGRTIYSAGFPFDSKDIRITNGEVSQLTDIPFDDGTQIGYTIDKGQKGIRQGMSGGAIFDAQGNFLGINTIGIAPILPNYTYNDGSKPIPKLKDLYARANWGIPVYNFLTNVNADILYGYDNLPKVEHQVTPTGYMAKLNDRARKMTVRIENSGGSGSGVIVAREGSTYYVLTAKHVVRDEEHDTHQRFTDGQISTYDQDVHFVTSTVVAEGVDLAVVKFTSTNNYPISQLGEYSPNNNDLTFVGGFPNRGDINSPLWQWQLNPGLIFSREQGKLQTQDKQSFSEGYDLIYSSISYRGMSGGPVFNTDGNVIGIHGRGEVSDLNSLGISIQTFTGLVDKLHVNSKLLKINKESLIALNPADENKIIASMQNILKPQPGDESVRWLSYGNQLYRTLQYDSSVAAFDIAISKGKVLEGNYSKAMSLSSSKKYRSAEVAIAKAIDAIPANEQSKYYYYWVTQSSIFENLKQYDKAMIAIDTAIKLEPKDLKLLNKKAVIFSEKEQYADAIVIYDTIIGKKPEAYVYYNRGNSKYYLGRKQEAILDYNLGIYLNPQDADLYNNRGYVKAHSGYYQEAIVDYDRAISLRYKFANAYFNRGHAKSNLGYLQDAILDYDRAILLDPSDSKAYNNRCKSKSDLGYKEEAIIDCDSAITIDTQDATAYNNRGNAKSALGYKQEAIIDYNRAIAIKPQEAYSYSNRGLTKFEIGSSKEAIIDYDKAISLDPNLAEVYCNRSIAKLDLGDKNGAIIDIGKCIELFRQQGRTQGYKTAIDLLKKIKRQ